MQARIEQLERAVQQLQLEVQALRSLLGMEAEGFELVAVSLATPPRAARSEAPGSASSVPAPPAPARARAVRRFLWSGAPRPEGRAA